jgi:hypothetical protein
MTIPHRGEIYCPFIARFVTGLAVLPEAPFLVCRSRPTPVGISQKPNGLEFIALLLPVLGAIGHILPHFRKKDAIS